MESKYASREAYTGIVAVSNDKKCHFDSMLRSQRYPHHRCMPVMMTANKISQRQINSVRNQSIRPFIHSAQMRIYHNSIDAINVVAPFLPSLTKGIFVFRSQWGFVPVPRKTSLVVCLIRSEVDDNVQSNCKFERCFS